MRDLSRYLSYIGTKIEGATTDNEVVTNFITEGDKVYCLVDDNYEAEFDCIVIDLIQGGTCIRLR